MSDNRQNNADATDKEPVWVNVVRRKVETLSFGVVQIVVHDSKVVQIERTEKTRLEDGVPVPPGGCRG